MFFVKVQDKFHQHNNDLTDSSITMKVIESIYDSKVEIYSVDDSIGDWLLESPSNFILVSQDGKDVVLQKKQHNTVPPVDGQTDYKFEVIIGDPIKLKKYNLK